jgi:5,10-methylenetetrahydromethanopterin reductase
MEVWTSAYGYSADVADYAATCEEAGLAGLMMPDSQQYYGDCYVGLALAAQATRTLGLATGVTNPVTRHPAITASAIAAIQDCSSGRATLVIGRGDSALAHLGRAPARLAALESYVEALHSYLRGDRVPFGVWKFDEETVPPVDTIKLFDSPTETSLYWLRHLKKVPVEVVVSGPKAIAMAALHADRVVFAVGSDPDRLRWGIAHARAAREKAGLDPSELALGAYVNVLVNPDPGRARDLIRGTVATFARFSVMSGKPIGPQTAETSSVLTRLHAVYDMHAHGQGTSNHAAQVPDEFIDRFAIAGPAERCHERLSELAAIGIGRIYAMGVSPLATSTGALTAPPEASDAIYRLGAVAKDLLTT